MKAGVMKKGCILFFVKSPGHTAVKSRLAESIGAKAALELYDNFVLDMLTTLSGIVAGGRYDLRVCFYPSEAGPSVRSWLGGGYNCLPQQGSDLGERMKNAFRTGFADGYRRLLLLGSDTPDLTSPIITAGFRRLARHGAVIGPAYDGGYYLIGFRDDAFLPPVFDGLPWSTGKVFERTLDLFRAAEADVSILPLWRDIDTLRDLEALRERHCRGPFIHSRTMGCLLSYLSSQGGETV